MKAVVEVGRVFCFDRETNRVGAGEIGISKLAGVVEALRCSWDVVLRRYEERGGRFGHGDWGEAGRERSDILDGPSFWRRRRAYRISVDCCFAFFSRSGSVAGYGDLVNGGLVMEEDVDVIEASAKLVTQYFQRIGASIFHHWEDILLDYVEAFAREENDVMVEL